MRHTERTMLVGFDVRGEDRYPALLATLRRHDMNCDVVPGSGSKDYPEIAVTLGESLRSRTSLHSGLLVCGSGIGTCIAANKVEGIRAVRCHDLATVEIARRNSAANVMTLGADFVSDQEAHTLLSAWLTHRFDSERSRVKVTFINQYDGRRSRQGS